MTEYPEIAARFARETDKHQMTVLHDVDDYRHLRFTQAGGWYTFDLLTWNHKLVITGGVDFMFSLYPLADLFDMFRRTALVGDINPSYWQEKVVAGRDGVEDFSDKLLRRELDDTVKSWTEDLPDDKADALKAAVEEHFFGEMTDYNVEYESEAHRALHDFRHDEHYQARCACGQSERFDSWWDADQWATKHLPTPAPQHSEKRPLSINQESYQFEDWSEWRLRDYSSQFLWACHAIRWGIAQYDAAKKQQAVAA